MEVPRLRGQRKAGGRKEGCNGFLRKGGSEGGEAAVRVPGFLLDVFSELGEANPFSVWGEASVSQSSLGSNSGSSVTLENTLNFSEP